LRIRFIDRIHFFGRAHPENRAYALPIGKVGRPSASWLGGMNIACKTTAVLGNSSPQAA
jgi:hypothetical protein